MKKKRLAAALLVILTFAVSILLFSLRGYLENAISLGLLGIFIVNAVSSASFFLPTPAFLTVLAGGNLYNPFIVALIAAVGAALGDMLSFIFGFSGRRLAEKNLSKSIYFKILEYFFKRYGGWILFILAFIPNPLFDAVGIIAGGFKYSPKKFFTIVFVGRFLRFSMLALIGSQI